MKTTIASACTLMIVSVMSCTNVQQQVLPTNTGAKVGVPATAKGGGGVDTTASPTNAPTAVLTATGHIAAPIPSPTNNPITDVATVLTTSSWTIKYTVNGVENFTYQNVPFRFNTTQYNAYWRTMTADPNGGRMPVGFWYSNQTFFPQTASGITLAFCSIDKSWQPLAGTWNLNSASTENNVIFDRPFGDTHIRFVR